MADIKTKLTPNERDLVKMWQSIEKRAQKVDDVLWEALFDGLDSGSVSTVRIRDALVALGHKRKDLPKDLPPASETRGRHGW